VKGLVDKGMAYASEGDVYFRVTKDEDYGKLSARSLDDMLAGARIEPGAGKKHPMDFTLWKGAKPGEPSWLSPWGPGRPGWHIECTAMVLRYLGEQIDIHGGGQDLVFPHHENEIAQSESFTGCVPFAKYWFHNGLLQLGEQKMSKSLGNLVTVREGLDAYGADAMRLFVLNSHYRNPLTYSEETLAAAGRGMERIQTALRSTPKAGAEPTADADLLKAAEGARGSFVQGMDDDFNSPIAVAQIFDLAREINRAADEGVSTEALDKAKATLVELAGVLGFSLAERQQERALEVKPFVDLLVELRRDLRKNKQYELADQVRKKLGDLGVTLEDRPDGTTWRIGK
jgi:cysteinyl-tRNA synthetase